MARLAQVALKNGVSLNDINRLSIRGDLAKAKFEKEWDSEYKAVLANVEKQFANLKAA